MRDYDHAFEVVREVHEKLALDYSVGQIRAIEYNGRIYYGVESFTEDQRIRYGIGAPKINGEFALRALYVQRCMVLDRWKFYLGLSAAEGDPVDTGYLIRERNMDHLNVLASELLVVVTDGGFTPRPLNRYISTE